VGEGELRQQRPQRSSVFHPFTKKKASDAPFLFIENICLTGYIGGQKSTSLRVPIHTSTGVLPLAMQALLVTIEPLIDRVVFKLQAVSS
jgi:hypothetical protein